MGLCRVLNCDQEASDEFEMQPFMAVAVCTDHLSRLLAGDDWFHEGPAAPLLMTENLPPKVIRVHTTSGMSANGGVLVVLEILPHGKQSERLELLVDEATRRALLPALGFGNEGAA
jgi:hypothetical protein